MKEEFLKTNLVFYTFKVSLNLGNWNLNYTYAIITLHRINIFIYEQHTAHIENVALLIKETLNF